MIRRTEVYLSIETTVHEVYTNPSMLGMIKSMVGQLPSDQKVHISVEAIKEIPDVCD